MAANDVLPQDQPQRDEAKFYEDSYAAEKKYQEELAAYEADVLRYEKEQAEYQKALDEYNVKIAKEDAIRAEKDALFETTNQKYVDEIDALLLQRAEIARKEDEQPLVNWQPAIQSINWQIEETSREKFRALDALRYPIDYNFVMTKSVATEMKNYPYRSLSLILQNRADRLEAQRLTARRNSMQNAQAYAMKAAEQYAIAPKKANISLSNFGGKGVTPISITLAERISKIKPEPPKAISTVYGYSLTQSTNRPKYVGVKFAETKPTQKTDETVIQGFLNQYKSTAPISKGVLEGIVLESGVNLTERGKLLIKEITANRGSMVTDRTSTYTTKDGRSFNAKTGEGDIDVARSLGFKESYNMQRPTTTSIIVLPFIPDTRQDTINFSKESYADLVDKGIVKKPESISDKLKYYTTRAERPITNLLDQVGLGGDYRKTSTVPTVFNRFFTNVENSLTGRQSFQKGASETIAFIKKDPVGFISEFPVEAGLWFGGGKVIELGTKGIIKISQPISKLLKPYVKNRPVIDYKTGKIYPKRQKQLTIKQVNKPITTFQKSKIRIGKSQIQYDPKKFVKQPKKVKPDSSYKPAKRANEIDYSDSKLAEFTGKKIKLGKGQAPDKRVLTAKTPKKVEFDPLMKKALRPERSRFNKIDYNKLYGDDTVLATFRVFQSNLGKGAVRSSTRKIKKIPENVKPDPYYKAASRANEIDYSDSKLVDFTTKKVKLGKGITPTPKIVGKKPKVIESDPYYKAASRANEIDYSDSKLAEFTGTKIKLGKVLTPKVDPKRKIVKPDSKYKPPSIDDKIKSDLAKDVGKPSGSRGRLQTIQIQKIKKLKSLKKAPLSYDWSLQKESTRIPSTGSAPLKLIVKKEKKKKKIKQSEVISIGTVQSVVLASEYHVPPPRQSTQTGLKVIQVDKATQKRSQEMIVSTKQKSQTIPVYVSKKKLVQTEKLKTTVRQKQKLSAPTKIPNKNINRLKTPFRTKERQTQSAMVAIPVYPVVTLVSPPPIDRDKKDKEPSKVKSKKVKQFIGNVSQTSIIGIKNRAEITYNKKTIKKSLKEDYKGLGTKKSKKVKFYKKSKVKIF